MSHTKLWLLKFRQHWQQQSCHASSVTSQPLSQICAKEKYRYLLSGTGTWTSISDENYSSQVIKSHRQDTCHSWLQQFCSQRDNYPTTIQQKHLKPCNFFRTMYFVYFWYLCYTYDEQRWCPSFFNTQQCSVIRVVGVGSAEPCRKPIGATGTIPWERKSANRVIQGRAACVGSGSQLPERQPQGEHMRTGCTSFSRFHIAGYLLCPGKKSLRMSLPKSP